MNVTTQAHRRSPYAAGGLVLALALTGCGSQVAGGAGDANLPVLRIGTGTGAAADTALAGGAKGSSATDDPFPLSGTLPTGPASQAVYRYGSGKADVADVRRLAAAVGITAEPVRHAHGWDVTSTAGILRVKDGTSEWSYARGGTTCPSYVLDVDTTSSGSTVSCAIDTPTRANEPATSDATALDTARALLTALGADVTAARVLGDPAPARTVVLDPTVGGLPTVGIRTIVDVDGDGVVGGTGFMGSPDEGPAYPLISATAALDKLRAMPVALPAIACAEASECPEAKPQVVTGATLGLQLAYDDKDTVLVPAWLFSVKGSDEPIAMVAVEQQYLGEPGSDGTDGTQPGASSEPSTGTGSGSDPGSSGSSEEPLPGYDPADPGPQNGASRITAVAVSADGRTLTLTSWGGVCATYSGIASESGTEVRVGVLETPTIGKDMACIEIAKEIEVEVRLAAPLGDRSVVDADTGAKLTTG